MTEQKTLTQRLREQDWPEAADRIDDLEAALRKVRDMPRGRCAEDDANNWLESRSIADQALEAS